MTKVVINRCWGGFSISKSAAEFMAKRGNKQAKYELAEWKENNDRVQYYIKNGKWPRGTKNASFLEIDARYNKEAKFYGYGYTNKGDGYSRTDPDLIAAVEKLGAKASGELANLEIREIPDGIEWEIDNYDGMETIEEKHRSW